MSKAAKERLRVNPNGKGRASACPHLNFASISNLDVQKRVPPEARISLANFETVFAVNAGNEMGEGIAGRG